jgi:Flp pilus assembly protein TadD
MSKPLVPFSLLLLVSGFAIGPAMSAPPQAASTSATAPAAPDAALGQALFGQAITDTQAGRFADAENLYHRLTKLFPNVAAAWANLGLLAARQNHLDEANADLRKAAALEPTSAAFWSQISSIELRSGHTSEAEATARRALAIDPANIYGLGDLAGALLREARYDDALVPLKRLVALQGDTDPHASVSLIATLGRLGRIRDALPVAQKLAAHFPNEPEYQGFIGDLSVRIGDYAAARAAYARAYQMRPADTRAGINAAIADEATGDTRAAAALIAKIIAAHPNEPMPYYQQGRLFYTYPELANGSPTNFIRAAASYRQAMLLDPKNPVYLRNLALALMFSGDPNNDTKAEKFFDAALYVAPQDTVAHMGLGYLLEQQKNVAGAIEQYQTVLSYAPDTYDARRRLAGLLYAGGKKDEAYQQFQALADRTPGAKGALPLKEAASLQMNDHRYEDARRSYAAAVARDPKDVSAWIGEGQALEKLNRIADAETAYRCAVAAAPTDTTAFSALGNLLQQQHRAADAARLYEQFVAAVPSDNAAKRQLAGIYEGENRDDDALRVLRQLTVQRDDPTHLSYLLAPSGLLIRHGRSPEAVGELTQMADTYPITSSDGVEIRYALADAQQRASRPADTEKTLTALLMAAKDPEAQGRAHTALGQVYQNEARWDEAGHEYEDVLKIDPASAPARVGLMQAGDHEHKPEAAGDYLETLALAGVDAPNLAASSSVALVYQEQQTPARYLDFASRVAAKYPNQHDALALYANALEQQGMNAATAATVGTTMDLNTRLQKEADLFRRMAALDRKDVDARYRLGAVTEKLGNPADAIAAYQDALAVAGSAPSAAAAAARNALRRLGVTAPTAANAPAAPGPAPALVPGAAAAAPAASIGLAPDGAPGGANGIGAAASVGGIPQGGATKGSAAP